MDARHPLANLPTAAVDAAHESADSIVVTTRGISVEVGLPPNGTSTRMRPTELLMSAVAGCMLGSLVEGGAAAGYDWSSARIRVTNTDALDPPRIETLCIDVSVPGADERVRRLVPQILTSNSRMFNTISMGVQVYVSVADD